MCNNRWNLPRERCLGIESKIKNKMAALWQSKTSHHPRWRLFGVAVPTGRGGRIGAQLVSIGVDWAFNWLLEKMGGESSRLLEFLWIRSKRKKRERLRPRRRGDASVKDLPYRPNRCWKRLLVRVSDEWGRRCVFGTFRSFFCFGCDLRLSEVFGLKSWESVRNIRK